MSDATPNPAGEGAPTDVAEDGCVYCGATEVTLERSGDEPWECVLTDQCRERLASSLRSARTKLDSTESDLAGLDKDYGKLLAEFNEVSAQRDDAERARASSHAAGCALVEQRDAALSRVAELERERDEAIAEAEADPQAFEWGLRQMYPDPKFADTDTGFTTDAEMARFAMENARVAQEQLDRANAIKTEADKLYSPSIQRTIIKLGRAVVALRYRLIASRHYTVEKLQVALSESRAERDELRGAFLKLREEVEALDRYGERDVGGEPLCTRMADGYHVERSAVLSLLDRATTTTNQEK